jgi:hypothetical protein
LLEWLQFWNHLDMKPNNVKEESYTALIIFTRPYTRFLLPNHSMPQHHIELLVAPS